MRVAAPLIGSMLLLASCGGGGSDAGDEPSPTVAAASQTPAAATATPAGCTPLVYVVQAGDTLSAIAAAHNLDLQAIIDANELGNPNSLSIGQLIEIPCAEATPGP
jgi:LysM repeat protein